MGAHWIMPRKETIYILSSLVTTKSLVVYRETQIPPTVEWAVMLTHTKQFSCFNHEHFLLQKNGSWWLTWCRCTVSKTKAGEVILLAISRRGPSDEFHPLVGLIRGSLTIKPTRGWNAPEGPLLRVESTAEAVLHYCLSFGDSESARHQLPFFCSIL